VPRVELELFIQIEFSIMHQKDLLFVQEGKVAKHKETPKVPLCSLVGREAVGKVRH
jgi:hypothetical protein